MNPQTAELARRARLSACWIFVLLNTLVRDMHQLFSPGEIEMMISGVVHGTHVTDGLLLAAGIVLEIPIAMVLLCWLLPARAARLANLGVGPIVIAAVIAVGLSDLDDRFFTAMQVAGLGVLLHTAWTWPRPR